MRKTQLVELDSIKLDSNQPRKVILDSSITHLAQSLRVEGLIHNIELDEDHRIIVGEMRYRAAKQLGWKTIPATIYEGKLSAYERLRRQMAENLQQSGTKGGGESMNPIDTAKAWAKLYELKTGTRYQPGLQTYKSKFGVTGPLLEIANEVGVGKETVWEYVNLLSQPEAVIEDMLKGRPRTYYREANSAHPKIQEKLKKQISEGKFANRDQIREVAALSREIPELAKMNMQRDFAKESQSVNRILSAIVNLALGLKALPLNRINTFEQKLIKTQLEWLREKIDLYLEERG